MSRHLSTRNISSKSMQAFLSNLANRQTDRQTNKQTRAKHVPPPLSEVNKSQSEIKGPGSIKILDPVKDVYMLITCLLLKIFSLYIILVWAPQNCGAPEHPQHSLMRVCDKMLRFIDTSTQCSPGALPSISFIHALYFVASNLYKYSRFSAFFPSSFSCSYCTIAGSHNTLTTDIDIRNNKKCSQQNTE